MADDKVTTPAPPEPQETTQPQPATTEKDDIHKELLAMQEDTKTPAKQEETEEREEMYQSRYQAMTEGLKKFPAAYKEIMSEIKGKEVEAPKPKQTETDYVDEVALSPERLTKIIRDAVREETGGLLKQQRESDFFALEQQTANETIEEFKKSGVDDTLLTEAYAAVIGKYSIDIKAPGGPSQAVTALADELELRELRKRSGQRVTTVAEETKEKVEDALNVVQPPPASTQGPQEKSFEETIIEKMKGVGNPDAKRAIFKGEDS